MLIKTYNKQVFYRTLRREPVRDAKFETSKRAQMEIYKTNLILCLKMLISPTNLDYKLSSIWGEFINYLLAEKGIVLARSAYGL